MTLGAFGTYCAKVIVRAQTFHLVTHAVHDIALSILASILAAALWTMGLRWYDRKAIGSRIRQRLYDWLYKTANDAPYLVLDDAAHVHHQFLQARTVGLAIANAFAGALIGEVYNQLSSDLWRYAALAAMAAFFVVAARLGWRAMKLAALLFAVERLRRKRAVQRYPGLFDRPGDDENDSTLPDIESSDPSEVPGPAPPQGPQTDDS